MDRFDMVENRSINSSILERDRTIFLLDKTWQISW